MKQEVFNTYVDRICKRFNITPQQLFTKTKKSDVVNARHLLYYLCIKRPMRYITLESYMAENGYNVYHSTLIYGVTCIEDKAKVDKDYIKVIREIEQSI